MSKQDTDFDGRTYLYLPQELDAVGLNSLVRRLDRAAGAVSSAGASRALRRMRAKRDALKAALDLHAAKPGSRDLRALDQRYDRACGAVYRRIDALCDVDRKDLPEAPRAKPVRDALFPIGLAQLTRPYEEEWELTEAMLARTADSAVVTKHELEVFVGDAVLAALRSVHREMGLALGLVGRVEAKDVRKLPSLRALMRDVADAVVAYATQVLATLEDESEESRAAVETALAPIAKVQADAREGRLANAETEEDDGEDGEGTPGAKGGEENKGPFVKDPTGAKK